MCSGIKISDEIRQTHQALSIDKKNSKNVKYMILAFSENNAKLEIESSPEKTDPELLTFEQLVESLPKDDVRFVIYRFYKDELTAKDAVILLAWCGENASVRRRMILSSTTNTLKDTLSIGPKHSHFCENASEVTKEIILSKLVNN